MNKNLIYAVGLSAMMAACSSEDVLTDVQNSQGSDMFAGIEKVDADFSMGVESRLNTKYNLEPNDVVGFAWMTDGEKLETKGWAYQNHPLYVQAALNLKPETSIYVGEYFAYTPYDESVVSIENINFKVPADADLLSTWDGLGKDAIFISPKWTTVTKSGIGVEGEAGIDKTFTIYPRKFSNGVALELDYDKHIIDLKDETNNNTTYPSDAEIFDVKVTYKKGEDVVSINKFQYAPEKEAISESEWYDDENPIRNWETFKLAEEITTGAQIKASNVAGTLRTVTVKNEVEGGFTLKPSKTYVASRELDGDKFYMNALPALAEVDDDTDIEIVLHTTYGTITVNKPVNQIAKTQYETGYKNYFDGITVDEETKEPLEADDCTEYTESFVQVLGKNGKFETEIDFSTAIMNGMHVRDDAHLIQLLRYYRDYKLGTEYEEPKVTLYLDEDYEGEFKISKTSIALMQYINGSSTDKVELIVCREHGNPTIVVTNSEKEGLEVPTFNEVFGQNVNVYLQAQKWTWNSEAKKNTGRVVTIYNRGYLTVGSVNVDAGNSTIFNQFVNLESGYINFTADVATLWKINLTNHGTINIPATAHMRVYSTVINDVTEVTGVRSGDMGEIINNGVLGAVEDQQGEIYNYGKIYHNAGAKTYISSNASNEDFSKRLAEGTKIGIIEMQEADANVSVFNATTEGIITYTWPKDMPVYASPAVVRYNYLIVKENIEFAQKEAEIRYLEIQGEDVYVINKKGNLTNLQGVIVDKGYALNITEGNQLMPAKAAYIKGYVYNGGVFEYAGDVVTYFGGDNTDKENILKWSGF